MAKDATSAAFLIRFRVSPSSPIGTASPGDKPTYRDVVQQNFWEKARLSSSQRNTNNARLSETVIMLRFAVNRPEPTIDVGEAQGVVQRCV